MSESNSDFIDPLEDAERINARDLFRRLGFEPLAPEQIDSFQLHGRLWELIYALAGRRIFLEHTNHVSDAVLYRWIHDEWMEEEIADITPEADMNCHVDVSDFGNGLDPIIWLRFFASEAERQAFALEHNLKTLPPHEDPVSDRDRWLPIVPGDQSAADSDPDFMDDELTEEPDPLGLKKVDADIEAEPDLATPSDSDGNSADNGFFLIHPDELTDETLAAKLWEGLHYLACRSYYVLNTNHLSDRELYMALWNAAPRHLTLPEHRSRKGGWFQDFIGDGSEEHNQLWLRYYADETERAEYLENWPDESLPPSEKPPYNRDWRLPKGPI